jgi:hypothetical protein
VSILKRVIRSGLRRADLEGWYQLRRESYLRGIGWFRSARTGEAVDASGAPLPWFTYPAIHFLAGRVRPEMTVFEYGSGGSTLWWAQRVARVVSCEHDAQWYERTRLRVPVNVELHSIPLESDGVYAAKVGEYPAEFDVVVIDGRDRVRCARNSLGALRPGGVVVWDNSDRPEYAEGYDFLRVHGYRRLDFEGMGPINTYSWSTSIFYREDNCLGL